MEDKTEIRRKQLLEKPVGQLVEMIISLEEEVAETRNYRRRLIQIRNLCLDPEERARRGRPRLDS